MPRPRTNPFYALLGIVGFAFTITASSYCLSVLRGIRPATAQEAAPHPLEELMDRHGTMLLVGQLAVLAVATCGAIAFDHFDGLRLKRERGEATAAQPKPTATGPLQPISEAGET